jgi:uncharacterized protein (TIGR02246 family)
MKKRLCLLASSGLLVVLALGHGFRPGPSAAEDKKPAEAPDPKRAADDAAIRKQSAAFLATIEKGDAKALSAFWTEEGEYIGSDGTSYRGRQAIEEAYAKAFAKKATLKPVATIDSIRFLSRDTAVEEGYVRVNSGKSEQPASSRFSILFVREGGTWQMALLREWPDDGVALRDLDWLIGTWTAKVDDGEVRATYEWDENKKFIRVRSSIKTKDRNVTLTEMIARDPRGGTLRSWLFESEGGFGDGVWTWDGKRWTIEATGVRADGSEMTATNIVTRVDDDTFTWHSVDRTVDGEEVPNLSPVKIKRVK